MTLITSTSLSIFLTALKKLPCKEVMKEETKIPLSPDWPSPLPCRPKESWFLTSLLQFTLNLRFLNHWVLFQPSLPSLVLQCCFPCLLDFIVRASFGSFHAVFYLRIFICVPLSPSRMFCCSSLLSPSLHLGLIIIFLLLKRSFDPHLHLNKTSLSFISQILYFSN